MHYITFWLKNIGEVKATRYIKISGYRVDSSDPYILGYHNYRSSKFSCDGISVLSSFIGTGSTIRSCCTSR